MFDVTWVALKVGAGFCGWVLGGGRGWGLFWVFWRGGDWLGLAQKGAMLLASGTVIGHDTPLVGISRVIKQRSWRGLASPRLQASSELLASTSSRRKKKKGVSFLEPLKPFGGNVAEASN